MERGGGGVRKCNRVSVMSERQLQLRRAAVSHGLSGAGSALPGCEDPERSAASECYLQKPVCLCLKDVPDCQEHSCPIPEPDSSCSSKVRVNRPPPPAVPTGS